MQQKIVKSAEDYGVRHNLKIDKYFVFAKLFEEVGEFAQAMLIHQKKCRKKKLVSEDASKKELAKELSDVFGFVLLNAHLLDIDLEDALDKKWIQRHKI